MALQVEALPPRRLGNLEDRVREPQDVRRTKTPLAKGALRRH